MEKFRDRPRKKFRVSLIANIKCMLVTQLKICDVILIQVVMENRDFISLNQIGVGTALPVSRS